MAKVCVVEVRNMPDVSSKPYVVARFDESTNALWYWGAWDEEERANEVAKEIGGLVLEKPKTCRRR